MTIPLTHRDILASKALAHVATIGPNGAPQTNPVWFDWDGECLLFSQTTTRQKYRNIKRSPLIAISIVDVDDPYRYLEIRGSVTEMVDDADNSFINSLALKYMGLSTFPWYRAGDHRVIVRVRPSSTTSQG